MRTSAIKQASTANERQLTRMKNIVVRVDQRVENFYRKSQIYSKKFKQA
jgi:hypothetical protein